MTATKDNCIEPLLPFINAQEMHQKYPHTFDAPSHEQLAAIGPGDSVKVCTGDERFWVRVLTATETTITGMVDNDLLFADEHGLDYGDEISFGREHVYDVMKAA